MPSYVRPMFPSRRCAVEVASWQAARSCEQEQKQSAHGHSSGSRLRHGPHPEVAGRVEEMVFHRNGEHRGGSSLRQLSTDVRLTVDCFEAKTSFPSLSTRTQVAFLDLISGEDQ